MTGLIVGLTGGIGSGKSAAADAFADCGAAIVDTDVIAHELTGPGGVAIPALVAVFGKGVLTADGGLDRVAMRRLAFADPKVRKQLEGILHPMIRAEADVRSQGALAAGAPYVVLVVPLLVESADYRTRVSRVVVVDCDDETRIHRVMARSSLLRAEVERIIAAQANREDRLAAADDIIDNNGDRKSLVDRVAGLHRKYLAASGKTLVTG